MDSPLPVLRYERKFPVHGFSLAQVVATVRRHPALFREVYPPRVVNNLYLDSVGLRDYADHVAGVANRVKTRIRWYGALSGTIARPTLERKFRRGSVSGKLSWGLPALLAPACMPLGELDLSPAWAALPEEALRATVASLPPSLVNRYQRRYYLSADGRFRLTLDWDLQFLAPHSAPEYAVPTRQREPAVIIELKFPPEHAERATEITNLLPFRLARCSKYVLGIQATADR
jgi:hypothetical protein